MSQSSNLKESEAVENSDEINQKIRTNYQAFLDTLSTSDVVWGLSEGDDWVICDSNDFPDREVMPFWSDEKMAQRVCVGEWQNYKPTAIHFDDFIDDWLHGMHEDEVLAGVNWSEDLYGVEMEPLLLMDALLEEEE